MRVALCPVRSPGGGAVYRDRGGARTRHAGHLPRARQHGRGQHAPGTAQQLRRTSPPSPPPFPPLLGCPGRLPQGPDSRGRQFANFRNSHVRRYAEVRLSQISRRTRVYMRIRARTDGSEDRPVSRFSSFTFAFIYKKVPQNGCAKMLKRHCDFTLRS